MELFVLFYLAYFYKACGPDPQLLQICTVPFPAMEMCNTKLPEWCVDAQHPINLPLLPEKLCFDFFHPSHRVLLGCKVRILPDLCRIRAAVYRLAFCSVHMSF